MTTVILDNGAYSIKAGLASAGPEPRYIPNSISRSKLEKRSYVGDELDLVKGFDSLTLRSGFDRGYLVGWDVEKLVWDRIFSPSVLNIDPTTSSLLVTEPYNNLPQLQDALDQITFEEYEFDSCLRSTPASLLPYDPTLLFPAWQQPGGFSVYPECSVIVDAGYSYTHVIPLMEGKVVESAVKRIDVGGKLLTNHLKTLISFRQYNVMDQTHVVNDIKEATTFVSLDFRRDLDLCKRTPRVNPLAQVYALPDFSSSFRRGYIKSGPNATLSPRAVAAQSGGDINMSTLEEEEEQVLHLENERFSIPEVLFTPRDIGLEQEGLSETIARSISLLPEDLQGMFWANIGLIGGTSSCSGLKERLERDLRSLCPTSASPVIYTPTGGVPPPEVPYRAAWTLANSPVYKQLTVSRKEFLEFGSEGIRKRFADRAAVAPAAIRGMGGPSGKGAGVEGRGAGRSKGR